MMSRLARRARASAILRAVLMAAAMLDGCGDIRCPTGTVAQGDSCVCANGEKPGEPSRDCSPDVRSDAPEDGGGPIHRPDPDAPGRMTVDAGATTTPPAASSDAAVLPPTTAQPGEASDSGAPVRPSTSVAGGSSTAPNTSTPAAGASDSCDDGNENPFDACANHRKATCGDGFIRTGHEDCEIGVSGATAQNCRECRRTRWLQCDLGTECTEGRTVLGDMLVGDACVNNICTPYACPPGASPDCTVRCPELPGHFIEMKSTWCMVTCGVFHPCPVGLKCDASMQICVGASFPSEAVIEPNREQL